MHLYIHIMITHCTYGGGGVNAIYLLERQCCVIVMGGDDDDDDYARKRGLNDRGEIRPSAAAGTGDRCNCSWLLL